ncbi:MAG: DUF1810 family protein [Rhodobacteraceae bacterium]|jgi:uncharacterized protein (DUF1810 family)|nr:DUF1810 family protein [Paracoccaceae bacterium]
MDRLERFLDAQEGVFAAALHELRSGRKATHWMWFVFPQLAGLGRSATARHFGIEGLEEARAYLAHPVLGPRLAAAAAAVLDHAGRRSAEAILGPVDALKLRSSATLFAAAGGGAPFAAILASFFGGQGCPLTLAALGGRAGAGGGIAPH